MTKVVFLSEHNLPPQVRRKHVVALENAFDVSNYTQTFPLAFGPHSQSWHCLVMDESQPLAGVSVLPVHGISHEHRISFACIGSVFTIKSHQGRGLAQLALQSALAEAQIRKLDAAILFATDKRLYKKFGFRCGQDEVLVGLSSTGSATKQTGHSCQVFETHSWTIAEARERWAFWVRNFKTTQNSSQFTVSFQSWMTFLMTENLSLMEIRNQTNGSLDALAFYGKGADFSETWHSLALNQKLSKVEKHSLMSIVLDHAGASRRGSQFHFQSKEDPLLPYVAATMPIVSFSTAMILAFNKAAQKSAQETSLPTLLSI